MDEKTATNVTAESSAAAPAKTAENESPIAPAPAPATSSIESSSETLVSPRMRAELECILEVYLSARHIPTLEEIDAKIDNATADLLAHLTPMLTAVVGKSAAAQAPLAPSIYPIFPELQIADPVKVWADPEHNKFRVGEVVAVHAGGHAFDVKLDDDTVTKVPADGLEYDDRR